MSGVYANCACLQVEAVARLCAAHGIPHVVNNAYGVQSASICSRICRACRVGRVDVLVQSTDKNFLVPVGGAVAALPRAPRPAAAEGEQPPEYEGVVFRDMAARYPGRAAAAAHVDLMITLLHLGERGWLQVLSERKQMFRYLQVRTFSHVALRSVQAFAHAGRAAGAELESARLCTTRCRRRALRLCAVW